MEKLFTFSHIGIERASSRPLPNVILLYTKIIYDDRYIAYFLNIMENTRKYLLILYKLKNHQLNIEQLNIVTYAARIENHDSSNFKVAGERYVVSLVIEHNFSRCSPLQLCSSTYSLLKF